MTTSDPIIDVDEASHIAAALVQCGVPGAGQRHAKLAAVLAAQGITWRDIRRAHATLADRDGHGQAQAGRILSTLLEGGKLASVLDRSAPMAPSEPAHSAPRRGPTNTAHDHRVREMQALGCTLEQARDYERGGYLHAGIVGDLLDPFGLAQRYGISAWDAVQAASAWAQRFGGGTTLLRRRLEQLAKSRLNAAKAVTGDNTAATDMRARLRDEATRLDELREGVPEPKGGGAGVR